MVQVAAKWFRNCWLLPFLLLDVAAAAAAGAVEDPARIRAAAETYTRGLAARRGLVDVKVQAQRIDRRLRLGRCQQPLDTSSNTRHVGGRVTVAVRQLDRFTPP